MKRMLCAAAMLTCLSLLLASCSLPIPGLEKGPEMETAELTERQKSILEADGLPADFEELSYAQKESILAIEEMLCHLEETYEEPFAFSGYRAASDTEPEYLQACRAGDPEKQVILVERTGKPGKYKYEDNYASAVAAVEFQENVSLAVGKLLPEDKFFTVVELYGPAGVDQTILSSAASTSVTILDEPFEDDEIRDLFFDKYGMAIYEEDPRLPATCLFYVLSHEDYADCDPSNYQDFIREKQYLQCYTCSISENFDVYIFER